MLAPAKLKVLDGRARFQISRFRWFRKERMSSRLEDVMEDQRSCLPSTMESHSTRAESGEEGRRWLKRDFMALEEGSDVLGIRRTRRERMSPMPCRC